MIQRYEKNLKAPNKELIFSPKMVQSGGLPRACNVEAHPIAFGVGG